MNAPKLIATFFHVGYMKPASGTWGSLAALPAFYVVNSIFGPFITMMLTLLLFVVGLWATGEMTKGGGDHDPSEIVIDEVVGQWIALWPVALGAWIMGTSSLDLWPGWIVAFFAFRGFDIWKPWIVGMFDRRDDAAGVMLDDVAAGMMAAITVVGCAALAHGLM